MANEKLRVCMLGEFDSEAIFNRTAIEGLGQNGCEITLHNAKGKGFSGKIGKFMFILKARTIKADIFYVPYPVRSYAFPAKIVSLLTGKPLAIDFLVSDYANRAYEHRVYDGSLIGKSRRLFDYAHDYLAFSLADLPLVDTKENGEWFSSMFHAHSRKFCVKHISESPGMFSPKPFPSSKKFAVVYFLGYLPAHNVPYVLEAASLLKGNKDIKFRFIGGGPRKPEAVKKARELKLVNVEFVDWVPYGELPEIIAQSHVVLGGPFTRSEKADRVITSKTYTGMACARPVVVGRTPCTSRFFRGNENAVVMVDTNKPADFAEKISMLYSDRKKAEAIGKAGYKLFTEKFSPGIVGSKLKKAFLALLD